MRVRKKEQRAANFWEKHSYHNHELIVTDVHTGCTQEQTYAGQDGGKAKGTQPLTKEVFVPDHPGREDLLPPVVYPLMTCPP